MNSISLSDTIKSSWHIFKKHWKFIVPASIATVAIEIILQILQDAFKNQGAVLSIIVSIFVVLIGIIIALGWSQVLLMLIRQDIGDWNDFKTEPMVWLQLVKTTLWYILYIFLWGICCVIPYGILAVIGFSTHVPIITMIGSIITIVGLFVVMVYFMVRYQFIDFVVLDNPDLASRKVFQKTGAVTKGNLWWLLWIDILLGLFNLVGLICIGVGLFVTVPVSKLARAKIYGLLKAKQMSDPEPVVMSNASSVKID